MDFLIFFVPLELKLNYNGMKKVLLLVTLLYATIISALALQEHNVKNIGIRDGLSNGYVVDICMDAQGFVWAATEHGLNRIAGTKCTVFTPDNSDISNFEHVGLLYHEKTNSVWIHSRDGRLDVYDCRTQRITPFLIGKENMVSVADLALAADSGIWIAHYFGDIRHYDPVTKQITLISGKNFPQIKNGVRSITDDGKGNLYIGLRMDGLIIYNIRSKQSRYFRNNPADPNSLPGDNVRSVFVDHMQNVWVGTNMGLALFDPLKGTFRVFRHERNNTGSLAGDNIHQVTETRDNTLWICSEGGGISKLNLNMYSHPYFGNVVFQQMTKENSGLSSNNTRRVLEDPYGNIWVGNYSTGVDFIPGIGSPFQINQAVEDAKINVSAIYIDKKDNLWIGEDNKVMTYKGGEITRSWDFSPYISNSSSFVYLFTEDKQGNIWFGTTDNGALKLNPATGAITKIACTKAIDVNALFTDHNGTVWIGGESGVFTVSGEKETVEAKINKAIGASSIPFSIIEDRYGKIWVGTLARGIFVFDRNRNLVAHLGEKAPFPSSSINQIISDENGGIWVATHLGLVYVPDARKPTNYKVFNDKQGLKDNHIRALAQDRMGNIWLSTFSGIACFDVNKQKFFNFDYKSGIPMGNFVIGAAAVSSTGTVYFGSPSGICSFNPQVIQQQDKVSQVEIIDCERIESQTDKGKKLIIEPDEEGRIVVKYNENTFRIAFTMRDYSQNMLVDYSYKMEGLDDEWYTDSDNGVVFRNLDPGEYTFVVRAKLKNQDWNEASIARLTVCVEPPLWLTWWAKTLYLLLVAGIVYYIMRSYKNEIKLRSSLEKTKWESQQKIEMNEDRLRFFTNITHELRTPLTLIMGPLEDLMADSRLPEALQKKVKSIHASSVRLLDLINKILEFRKTETQNRRLSVARSNLCVAVGEIGSRFKDLNRNPKLRIEVNMPEKPVEIFFDSEVISTVVNNLMSNAIKYTQDGSVTLSLKVANNRAAIVVSDTGYGISKDALPHIFERYYQAKGLHQASGTGIGLALVKSLAELHHALLTVDSVEGSGSTFSYSLDMQETYPDALHKDDDKEQMKAETDSGSEGNADGEERKDSRPVVLIVEDNDDIRTYIDESLQEDYRILQARNGKEGCDMAFLHSPDIIVSDIMMPEMDGIEMTKVLKNDMRTSHIPIIILTAKTSPQDQEEGYDSGADSYLMKPFSAHLLNSRIRNIMSGRRRLAEIILQRGVSVGNITTASQNGGTDGKTSDVLADGMPDGNNVEDLKDDTVHSTPELSPLDKKFMDKLNMLINENIATEDIDIAFMTDKFAMSHSTFYRKVKALTGVSANEYIRKVKLQRAMELLKTGEYNVTEVSMMTGFNNIGYFRRSFKKEFDVTPSEVLKK